MFNNIINDTLFVSTLALSGGVIYKCLKDFYDDTTRQQNHYISHSNSIFNSGMFIGGLIGVTSSYLNETLKLEN